MFLSSCSLKNQILRQLIQSKQNIYNYKDLIRKMSIFVQKLNPLTGDSEWILKDEHYDYFQEIARSSFADMLHDTERNQKYFQALRLAIEKMHKNGKKANVLDIGTGTGLLSMMAVQSGADSVVACEAFRPMSQCALKILKDNHFELDIKVIPKRSTDLTVGSNGDLKQRANILVTEVFDTELIGEGALETFRHAHDLLLEKDCIVIPNSGTIYGQVVESSLCNSWNTLKSIANSDGDILLRTPPDIINCPGTTTVHDLQLSQLPSNSFTPITDPIEVFKFDWSGKIPFKFENQTETTIKAKRDGTAQQVFMWWDLDMDPERTIILSCAPFWAHPDLNKLVEAKPSTQHKQDLIPWRDHWMQAIYYLPKSKNLHKGQALTLISSHDEYSLWFNLKEEGLKYLRPICECMFHVANSRTRIGQMNHSIRNKKLLDALENCVKPESVCLSISDGSFISLAIAKMGKHLYCLERNQINRRILQNYVNFNNINAKVTILESEERLLEIIPEIDLIFSEPYFFSSLNPWDNLQLKYLLNKIAAKITPQTIILPSKGSIKAIGVEFLDLHKIRSPLQECEGFIMDKFDKLINLASALSDDIVEPQPLWEYPSKALSKTCELYEFHLRESFTSESKGEIELIGDGVCNGVALWVDWDFNGVMVSTGPVSKVVEINERITWDMYTRQGVFFVKNPKDTKARSKLPYLIKYDTIAQQFYITFKKVEK